MGILNFIANIFLKKPSMKIETVISYRDETKAELLMKEASDLKKEKRYTEAISKIHEAFSSDGVEYLGLWAKLKLVTYLQLDNKWDEAWRVLNEANVFYTSPESQYAISDKMRLHLQREGKYDYAIPLGIYSLIKEVEYRRDILGEHLNDSEVNQSLRHKESIENIEKTIDSLIKKSTKKDLREYFISNTRTMINSNLRYNYRDILNMVKQNKE